MNSQYSNQHHYDAMVIGGGFYGCCIAIHLCRELGFKKVCIVEQGPVILGRASYNNQARVHGGYHYPRDFTTAYRSRISFSRFVERYKRAIDGSFLSLYAIARRNSHVTARGFERAMTSIGAPCVPAGRKNTSLFSPTLIEAVFETEEFAFNSLVLAEMLSEDLASHGIDVMLDTMGCVVARGPGTIELDLKSSNTVIRAVADVVFNCTYGRISHIKGIDATRAEICYQLAELCLVDPPDELQDTGVTVMDGPFFSCMPFPSQGLHSLSHVRYTPHVSWKYTDYPQREPYDFLNAWTADSMFDTIIRDASRLLPAMVNTVHRKSLFEVKAILTANSSDNGRPILVEGSPVPGGVVSVLGGKLDNIFDVLSNIDKQMEQIREQKNGVSCSRPF